MILKPWTRRLILVSTLFLVLPLIVLLNINIVPNTLIWSQIRSSLLNRYLFESLRILVLSVVLSMGFGSSLAFIFHRFHFKFKRFLLITAMLPLAIPSYVYAMIAMDFFSVTGPVYAFLGPIVMNHYLIVSVIFALTLYPYVLITTLARLSFQGNHYQQMARSLGKKPWVVFMKISLPFALPGMVAGGALVGFEVLNDYGTVSYLGTPVLSFLIYDAWFRFGSLATALHISRYYILFTVMVAFIFWLIKQKTLVHIPVIPPKKNNEKMPIIARLYLYTILVIAFVAPLIYLVRLLGPNNPIMQTINQAFSTMTLAILGTLLITFLAVIFIQPTRKKYSKMYAISMSGYVIPGTIIAIVFLTFFNGFGNLLGFTSKIPILFSFITLLLALVFRFIKLMSDTLKTKYDRLNPEISGISQSLGMSPFKTFIKVDLPLIKPALIGGALLVILDIIKELPLTMVLRPIGFETLASSVYRYMMNEQLASAAFPALVMIFLAAICVIVITKESSAYVND